MTLYARNDCGIIRCAECDVRFGEVRDDHVLVDSGWKIEHHPTPRFSNWIITLSEYNASEYRQALDRGNLRFWRARRKTDNRPRSERRGRPSNYAFTVVDATGTPWIECPEHGLQLIDHGILGTTEWFEDQPDLGSDVWVVLPPEDASESSA